jgi:AraC-like DNA-binding protein
VAGPGGEPVRVLPDACVDLVWRHGAGALLAGPDTRPVLAAARPGEVIIGLRFGPGAGGPALGLGLEAVRDARVPLGEILPALDRALPGDLGPDIALARLIAAGRALGAAARPDPAVREAARRLAEPSARVDALARELGLSERQLRRRCLAAVGYGPKTLQRVLRFRRFLALGAGGGDLAAIAAEAGYADQPHLTRESRRLAGATPAALLRGGPA